MPSLPWQRQMLAVLGDLASGLDNKNIPGEALAKQGKPTLALIGDGGSKENRNPSSCHGQT